MSFVIEDVLVRNDPVGIKLPVLLDSPHSGKTYPLDFRFICPLSALRQAEDTDVDELLAGAPEAGATLLCALFPRSYIDPNRAIDDIDPGIIDGVWPDPLRPTDKSALGIGLIRWLCRPGMPMYDGRLLVSDVADRIDHYYRPYHFQVQSVLDGFAARFGAVWHINCHSMPSGLTMGVRRQVMPDFVVGDLGGVTADRSFVSLVCGSLRDMGYSVAVNDPYKGVELIARYGNPQRGRYSIQLEINRALYMDEETLLRTAGFDRLQRDLGALVGDVCAFARDRVARIAAE